MVDPCIAAALNGLAEYWPTLAIDAVPSDASVKRKGDIIEIVMAALRGQPMFEAVMTEHVDRTGIQLQQASTMLIRFCRLIHYMVAHFHTGWVKYLSSWASSSLQVKKEN